MNDIFTAWTGVIGVNIIYTIYAIMLIHALFAAIFDRFFP
jgi:hypothetical protein